MSSFWLVLLVLTALLGNFYIRCFVRKIDQEPDSSPIVSGVKRKCTPEQFSRIMSLYGKSGDEFSISKDHLPINQALIDLAGAYEEISFDPLIKVFDRSLMQDPFVENPEFLQIGVWGDGSEMLVRRHSDDPKIYIASIEDGDPQHPSILANSFADYVLKALLDFEESQKEFDRTGR